MERKTLLEKLGLIEKIESEDGKAKMDAGDAVQSLDDTAFKDVYLSKEVEVKERIEENTTVETKAPDAFEDPVLIVRSKKLMEIDGVYRKYNINSEGINSLSIVESFQKALPDYLPADVKRQSILNIIASSNVRIENLLKDGEDKLKSLNDFSGSFIGDSDKVIAGFQDEIKKLKEKIDKFEEAIAGMEKLQTEQNYVIKYETDKINNILKFINSEE